MPRLEIGMSNEKGFTLLEILVVVVIIGITIGFAMLAFGDFGAKRQVIFASEQLVNDVKLVQHQAALEISTYGILINKDSYRVFRLSALNRWDVVSSHPIFRRHVFPGGATLRFQPRLGDSKNPQIIINDSGDMTPFHLMVEMKGKVVAEVIGQHSGLIQLKTTS